MANGSDEVKEAADWVTGNIEEDGVAQAIEKFFKLTSN
jgi:hydroxymethylpyrimidine pyrophosphatase-like HAD family hydrolase